ncbi:MAG: restriction endonuclease subunit S [Syntrophales bacterium]|nr:restriction endonuclease subunit S [Syntrophales bacterium]
MTGKRKLPQNWQWEKLGNLFNVDKKQIDSSNPSFVNLPFLGLENIEANTRKYISSETSQDTGESSCFLFDTSHVLYGKLRPYLNKVYLPEQNGRCSMELLPLKPSAGYSRNFVALILQSELVINHAIKHSTGGRMPRADINKFVNLRVPIPTKIEDAKQIVIKIEYKLAEIEKMRQAALRQKEATEAMPGAILRELFSFKDGERLPQGWNWAKIKDICAVNPNRPKGFKRSANSKTSFVPMDAIDESSGIISKRLVREYETISTGYTYFEEGDVLFAKITPCMQNGKSAIANSLIDGIGFGSTEFYVLRPKAGVTKEWIFNFIRTSEFRNKAEANFDGSAGQQRVPKGFLENAFIPLPSKIDEQSRITDNLSTKMREAEMMHQAANRQLEAIEAMPAAMLREVFDFDAETGAAD